MAHVKLYYNNPGYTMFSRYLKIVVILDIVITWMLTKFYDLFLFSIPLS